MSLINKIKKHGKKALLVLAIAGTLAGCVSRKPELIDVRDFTGDSIPDVMIEVGSMDGITDGKYLFIGQEDGNYIRTKEFEEDNDVKYFKTDDGIAYFFDGNFYKLSPKQE